ncbi:hypothetical protein C1H46_033947 [Malus baccata]|uniref:DDHD domain-containing protein n=1 Tax=Malus baccata TaxID=106549 RepID=A0A540L1X5_MALBA|nr:hypothetical protein C1H46_033947 [Malus baccata]
MAALLFFFLLAVSAVSAEEGIRLRSTSTRLKFHIPQSSPNLKAKVLTVCQSRNSDSLEEQSETTQEKEERSYGSLMMERVTGSQEGRIDHVLQDTTFEHPYLAAIGAHTNYWRDYDTALFILKHLYRGIHDESLREESSR